MKNIVKISNLSIAYQMKKYDVKAVNTVDLDIVRGKITALVGESGSGKTTLATALINNLSEPGVITDGVIDFHKDENEIINVVELKDHALNKFRWEDISMVFQGAQSALNPVMKIGKQFNETMRVHFPKMDKAKMLAKSNEVLEIVNLDPKRILNVYPHELSGGMKQRVMIAFSLLLDPKLIILDEPTTALDVITQNYVFNILRKINEEMGISMLLLTHDIAIVANFADYVAVMYGGRIMEYGTVYDVFNKMSNPYTKGLIGATPSLIGDISKMKPIEGQPPNVIELQVGCPFKDRCFMAKEICFKEVPKDTIISDNHVSKCHFAEVIKYE